MVPYPQERKVFRFPHLFVIAKFLVVYKDFVDDVMSVDANFGNWIWTQMSAAFNFFMCYFQL